MKYFKGGALRGQGTGMFREEKMSSSNKAILIGNLGAKPEVKIFENGESICRFSLATNSSWKDKKTNTWREQTQWHQIVLRDEYLVDLAKRRLTKGTKVYVEGAIETRTWENLEGQTVHTVEIVLRKFRGEMKVLSGGIHQSDLVSGWPKPADSPMRNLDDDIPF
ncbi:single-stranded DNA-binding protein [Ruegeria arenilitoris]|nr:single-stranded DNA-binding protein [Ruegeria arenilitoris]